MDETRGNGRGLKPAGELVTAALACAAFAYIATVVHLIMVDRPAASDISFWHEHVLAGDATSPNQYRPGAYLLAEWMKSTIFGGIHTAYHFERMLFTFTMGFLSFIFFRCFLPVGWSFAAIGWFFAIIPFTYIGYNHQPADPIYATLFVLVYLAMASRGPTWVIPLTAIGVFFRETSLLMPVFALAVGFDRSPRWGVIGRFIAGIVAGLAVYAAIRLSYGPAEHTDPFIMLGENLKGFDKLRFFIPLIFLPGGLVIWCWKDLEPFLKRSLGFALLFLIVHFIFGRFGETRLLLPILPLFICSALTGLKCRLESSPE